MFLAKKIISPFLFPLPILLGLSLLGILVLWFSKRTRLGKVLVTIGVLPLILIGYPVVSDSMLSHYENQYPLCPLQKTQSDAKSEKKVIQDFLAKYPVKYVLVLGGGHVSDPNLPVTSQINMISMVRLVEGIRLFRKIKNSKLVLSGGANFDPQSNARIMEKIAVELGVDPHNMIIEDHSKDTQQEATLLKPLLGNDPFILVTSAAHMPRSVTLFKSMEMNPVPAPCAHLVKERQQIRPGMFFPSSFNITKAENAVYECLGNTWVQIKRYIID